MEVLILTNEYPPHVYGGAGVHVKYLARELAKLVDVDVRAFGDQDESSERLRVLGFEVAHDLAAAPEPIRPVLAALSRDIGFLSTPVSADVVHCHTWYALFGGILAKVGHGLPLVVTTHSLEPLRPWKREQLGGGYDVAAWIERTALEMADAVVAVSRETRDDVLRLFDVPPERVHVIHNGIDTDEYHPVASTAALERYGIEPGARYVLFVGRITRQKGIVHLVRAIRHLAPSIPVVLCAGAPDTPEIAAEMEAAVAEVRGDHPNVVWIAEMVDRPTLCELYSHAAVFCCPSVYEPFGIINLEAMACETAVVATAVGGIPEVVIDGETGMLVPLDLADGSIEPRDADRFERDLARTITALIDDPQLSREMGRAGRRRAIEHFSWSAIARRTVDLYGTVLDERATRGTSGDEAPSATA